MSKKKVDFGFTPSKYQQEIFDFVTDGVGNATISAAAGSGKTSTIVAAMKLIPSKQKCLFLAFNKSIANELSDRLHTLTNVHVKTSHSLGFLMLRRNLGNDMELDEYKYRTYIKNNIVELSSVQESIRTRKDLNDYLAAILDLVNFSRFNYCQSVKEIDAVSKKYSIPIKYDECEVTLKALEWGKENTSTIDYTDMVWLPVELKLKPLGLQYDWVFVDECQDQSIMSIELFKKCFKRGTRAILVGDPKQAIYAFAGSSEEAFNMMKTLPNTQTFDLPISYRCDKNIINAAKEFVPNIEPREDAGEGAVLENCHISDFKEGDMVLARTKAPLVKLYVKLLKKGVNCYIKGQDIGSNLIKSVEPIDCEEMNPKLDKDGVFTRLYEKLFKDRNNLMEKRGLDYDDATLSSSIMEEYDNINTLLALSENCRTKTQLINHIRNVFDNSEKGICLSTIHKAKGLEADNVYIVCHSTMPSKLALQEWEKSQEENLVYVAYTRAKHKLGFVSEREVPPCGSSQEPMAIINDLMYIENKICALLGTEPTVRMSNVDIAKFNIKNATKVEEPKKEVKCVKDKTLQEADDLLLYLDKVMMKEIDKGFGEGDLPDGYDFFNDETI